MMDWIEQRCHEYERRNEELQEMAQEWQQKAERYKKELDSTGAAFWYFVVAY